MKTTKHKFSKQAQHAAFGTLLTATRKKAGIAQQSDLAALMKTTQQTISRWEAGLSRPRDKQMQLLARVLNIDLDELLTAAGYTAKVSVATFDKPFPVEALHPESFERFCLYFLAKLYPTAVLHPAGQTGHSQEGLDVDATFPDNTCYTFQCKRVDEFGPAKVHRAVAKHIRAATKKFLLLSRVASPQARQAIRQYPEWDIWDKADISRHIRTLSKEDQRLLVDTFFRGQRLALLGETEPGPWQTSEAFFAPFSGHGLFNHAWHLVGRTEETRALVERLSDTNVQAVFLVGAGGAGKSRVLKEAIQSYEHTHRGILVRFLSPTEDVTNKSLEDLGDGEKILIVDDAHDRTDLQLLFQYASVPMNRTTLLLSFRPYGLDSIKAQATSFALAGECISEVKLVPLSLEQATTLATQVLQKCNGPVNTAKDIARLTRDCPLATVIGAQVVAQEKMPFELAKNEEVFRSTLFGKFRDIIAGNIGYKNDAEPIRKLLRVLALVQPFHPDDASISHIGERVEGLRAPEVKRLVRLLTDAGVLFKRGGKYRLSPDLLADFIIEEVCIGHDGRSTGYAEQVFDAAGNNHLAPILLNLGKLDWRLANGDPSNSRLLDGLWGKLQPSQDFSDPHIEAVTAVAYYQPARALAFAEHLICEGKSISGLPQLIKYAAYNFEYLQRACECLWELGKDDNRALNSHQGHAIRILANLCAVEPNKPIKYNEIVVDFGLSLLDQAESWSQAYTPFDILQGILRTEGHTTGFRGRNMSSTQYFVSLHAVALLRRKVIDATIQLLVHQNTKFAVRAAHFLQESLQYPMRPPLDSQAAWTKEFVQTLERIEQAMQAAKLDPLVLIGIARSVSWHAQYANGETTPVAQRLIASLPNSLAFRTILALIDGHGQFFGTSDFAKREREWNRSLAALTNDLLSAYPDGEHLRAYIEQHLVHIETNYITDHVSPYVLYGRLIQASSALAQVTVQTAVMHPASRTTQFAGQALSKLLGENHANGIVIARRFLASHSPDLHVAVGRAYSGWELKDAEYGPEDLAMLREILMSTNEWVVRNAIGAIRTVAKKDQRLAIDLLKCVNISIANEIADDVLLFFQSDDMIPSRLLTPEDIDHLLKKLMMLPQLDGYWIEAFLSQVSEHHASRTAAFFMDRVEHAANTEDWHFRPCNHGPYSHIPLRFRASPKFGAILRQVMHWMQSRGENDYLFHHRAAELFEIMFQPFDNELLVFLHDWIDTATPHDIRVMTHILQEASPAFVFQHRPFVTRFLEKVKQYGKDALKNAENALYCSAVQGMRSGIPGEPFPEDLQMQEEARKALNELSRFSPAYRLYESIKQSAEQNIQRSLQDRETFED